MANLNIRKLPDKTYKKIKERAKQNGRSMNSEIIYILNDKLELKEISQRERDDLFSSILKLRKKSLRGKKHIDSVKLIRQMRDEE